MYMKGIIGDCGKLRKKRLHNLSFSLKNTGRKNQEKLNNLSL
jgi:hypothetical protein